jgi:hypothetical protein
MEDLLYVAVVVVFFALMAGLVWACDKIVGPDDEVLSTGVVIDPADPDLEEVAA